MENVILPKLKKLSVLVSIAFAIIFLNSCIIHEWFNDYTVSGVIISESDYEITEVIWYDYENEIVENFSDFFIDKETNNFTTSFYGIGRPDYKDPKETLFIIEIQYTLGDDETINSKKFNLNFKKEVRKYSRSTGHFELQIGDIIL